MVLTGMRSAEYVPADTFLATAKDILDTLIEISLLERV